MKKIIALFLSVISAFSFAQEVVIIPIVAEQQMANLPKDYPPILKLAVVDISDGTLNEIQDKKYSIKNSGHNLCWIVFNMPFSPSNQITEVFSSPKKANFSDPNGSRKVSKNGKNHTISIDLPSQNDQFIQRCWKFDKKDPVGKYTLAIKINGINFPAQTFEVIK